MDRDDGTLAMTAHVLIVAGSDSSGGAGIARDIETVSAVGARTCLAVTAVTVQTHEAVKQVEPMPAALVARQMRAALSANPVAAVKIGMLGAAATVEAVAGVLADHPALPLVLDPVLASTSGGALLADDALAALRESLMPLCLLVTPNIPELAALTGSAPAKDEADLICQGGMLLAAGIPALLVKGGHAAENRATDLLLRPDLPPLRFDAPRLHATMRGTGCMLSSAIAAHLALEEALEESVQKAKAFVFGKLGSVAHRPAGHFSP
jgi:hydroxymethylpyrimidine/phosphomethylpyrimidine kinase